MMCFCSCLCSATIKLFIHSFKELFFETFKIRFIHYNMSEKRTLTDTYAYSRFRILTWDVIFLMSLKHIFETGEVLSEIWNNNYYDFRWS